MKNSRVTVRYAKSLYELAAEKNELDRVIRDMKFLSDSCNQSRELTLLLKSPIIHPARKAAVIKKVFQDNIGTMTLSFINILVNKRREEFLADIADEFYSQYKEHKNIITAYVITANELSPSARQKILGKIKNKYPAEVELIEKTDKKIIGGYLLRIGDKQFNGTLSFKIAELKKQFKENPYIGDFKL